MFKPRAQSGKRQPTLTWHEGMSVSESFSCSPARRAGEHEKLSLWFGHSRREMGLFKTGAAWYNNHLEKRLSIRSPNGKEWKQ